MIFARKVWHLLVAIKDGLVLLLLLLFFALLYAALTARPGTGSVQDGALLLRLDGAVVEEPAVVDPLEQLLATSAPVSEYRARDVVRALNLAAKDDRIKAVVLDLSRFTGGGLVHMQDIGAALDTVRAAKKPVLAYAVGYADDGLLLAAHASEVWVDPMGGAFILGPGGNQQYFAGLLDRFKITAHVFRVGTFKSAVEPYLLNEQSEASRENASALYGALFESWKDDVRKARPKAKIDDVSRDPAGWLQASGGDAARAALAGGLVDQIGTKAEFGARVAKIVGAGPASKRPGSFAHTPLGTWLAANPESAPGKAIGVVTIAGTIVDGDAGPGTAGGERIAGLLDAALDDDLAALVVRVDSPGGSVTASEEIRLAIARHKARGIPVIVSMGNLAASGGYWVATPASTIFAEPATLTGSIGVFAVFPSFERALGDYGVTSDGVQTTPLSGQPDLIGGLSPAVTTMIQSSIESNYGKFLGLVAKSRGRTAQQIDTVAQGRVWDGGAARQIGLVDQFGGLDDALAAAAKAAKLSDGEWHAKYLGADVEAFSTLLERIMPDEDSAPPAEARDFVGLLAARQAARGEQALRSAASLLEVRGARAECLECPLPLRPAASGPERLSLLMRLARALDIGGS